MEITNDMKDKLKQISDKYNIDFRIVLKLINIEREKKLYNRNTNIKNLILTEINIIDHDN